MFSENEYVDALAKKEGRKLTEKLRRATVAVCGLGGLGSNVAVMLGRCGVGRLILTDNSFVDISDTSRQAYTFSDVGERKTDAVRKILLAAAPFCEVETRFADALEETGYLDGADVVAECLDNPETKAAFVNMVLSAHPQKPLVCAVGMGGMKPGNDIRTKKVSENFYVCGDGVTPSSEGLVGPRVMICAAHEALKILEIIEEVV
ncbi:MAG: thiamine biosynthesis protein ThiF [Clostridia bacterium]|nr:thiamine biosynthesis protein ThiF [Clostridia bacterium]